MGNVGRVQEVHPGPDGIARIAIMKTAEGSYVRPLSKLSILPIKDRLNQARISRALWNNEDIEDTRYSTDQMRSRSTLSYQFSPFQHKKFIALSRDNQ